ncbi:MAG: hypothetical protein H6704_14310 [Myxococcales bacterium]|nr:hypothetical protein [Myxococcales bacterium]MCB9537423.1 hypothetical protein [Myxococcales bacterium]
MIRRILFLVLGTANAAFAQQQGLLPEEIPDPGQPVDGLPTWALVTLTIVLVAGGIAWLYRRRNARHRAPRSEDFDAVVDEAEALYAHVRLEGDDTLRSRADRLERRLRALDIARHENPAIERSPRLLGRARSLRDRLRKLDDAVGHA